MAIQKRALVNFKWLTTMSLLTMFSSNAFALGLGKLEVSSNLDQPLDAIIELLVNQAESVESIEAMIASEDDFEELGIEYPSYLSNVRLTKQTKNGKHLLKLDSNEVIIKEPFIHFLVRVDWSGGSFLREYTALIDPPVYAADAPKSISSPKIVGGDESFQNTDIEDIESEALSEGSFSTFSEDTSADSSDNTMDAQYGPIASGESLSVIAQELQSQFPDLSIYQIMHVLFNENQEAFIDGNINGLIKGSVLNISDISRIRAVEVAEGKRFFKEHLDRWSQSNSVGSNETDSSLKVAQDNYASADDELSDEFASSSGDDEQNQFQVGAGSEFDSVASGTDSNSQPGEVFALQQKISDLETSLQSGSLENQELKERISILEGQLADMNKLVSLDIKDAELASLESTLAEQNAKAENDVSNPLLDGDVEGELVEELTDGIDESVVDIDDGELLIDEQVDSEVEDDSGVDVVVPVTVVTQVISQESLFDKVKKFFGSSMLGLLGVLGAIIAGFLGLVLYRKHRADEEFEVSMLSIETHTSLGNENNVGYASIDSLSDYPVTELSKTTNSESIGADESGQDQDKAIEENTKETSFLTVYSDSDAVVQADEVDPIAEADVYIAYGRDEQAEEVLKDGVSSFPDRFDIKHKLLGLYHKNDNKGEFERLAEELYADKDKLEATVWQEVAEMGGQILPDSPLFGLSEADTQTSNLTDEGDAVTSAAQVESADAQNPKFDSVVSSDQPEQQNDDLDLEETEIQADANVNDVEEPVGGEHDALDEISFDAIELDQNETVSLDEFEDNDSQQTEDVIDFDSIENDNYAISVSEEESEEAVSTELSGLDVDDDYDEARTQYELAKVFVDLGDVDGATKILNEMIANQDNGEELIKEANELLASIKS